MHYSSVLFTLAASASVAIAAPDGCSENFSGYFGITTQNVTAGARLAKRQAATTTCVKPEIKLNNGILIDQCGSQGEIVVNEQFQFDPPQRIQPHLFASGFSVCSNMTLAADSAVFYACNSGKFNNLYGSSIGGQCYPVYILVEPCTPPSTPLSCAPDEIGTGSISGATVAASSSASSSEASSTSAPASVPATSTSASTPAYTSSPVVAPTGTGSPAPSKNGTVSTAAPIPESFKGAASSLSVGQALVVVVVGLAGFALL